MAGDTVELAVTSSQGAMGPVIRELDSLLASKERLPLGVDKVKLEEINKNLKEARVSLQAHSKAERPSFADMYWMKEVRDLSYDTQDYLDMVQYPGGTRSSQVRRKWTKLVARDISDLNFRLKEANKRREIYSSASSGDNNPASSKLAETKETDKAGVSMQAGEIQEEADELPPVSWRAEIKELDKELISVLAFDTDQQLRVVAIFGSARVNRTLYHCYGGRFHCRAFLRVSRKPNTVRLLTSMLSQIKGPQPMGSGDAQALIKHIKRHLQGKSYLIILDELWDISVWDVIKRAFPEGNCYSRVIVTTQIEDVASACCEDQAEQKFLCNSERLNNNISQIYNDLSPQLKTCLLYLNMYPEDHVLRKVDLVKQWVAEGFLGVEGTFKRQKLSAAESRHEVDRNAIPDKESTAERYFNELVDKKILQPVEVDSDGQVLACIVHHTVLDFIAQKCMEDFITVVDYPESITFLPDRVRRLTVKFRGAKSAEVPKNLTVCNVRSLMFSGFFKCVPSLVEYWLLRILSLDIWGDQVDEVVDLGIIGELFQLRCLKIQCNITIKLPARIRRLKYLQTLDVAARVAAFPLDICCLKHLWHLRLPCDHHLSMSLLLRNIILDAPLPHILTFGVPGLINQIADNISSDIARLGHFFIFGQDGLVHRIGQMISLRSLRNFNISTCSSYSMSELGNLTNLQDLHLTCSTVPSSRDVSNIKWLVSNLCKSSHLKSLILDGEVTSNTTISFVGWSSASTTPALEKFELSPRIFIMSSLPEWVRWLSNLRTLKIAIQELSVRGVDILQELGALAALSLNIRTVPVRRIIFNKGFQALKYFKFTCAALCVEFTEVAMRHVQTLKVTFNVNTMQQYMPEKAGIRRLAGLKVVSAKIGGASIDQASREAIKRRLVGCVKENHRQLPIVNVKIVDWIIHGDTEQSSANVMTRRGSDEQHKIEETNTLEDVNRTPDSWITSWEPCSLMEKPGWVSRRPWNGVRLFKTVRGIAYVMRQHMKQAGFRVMNEVASISQDMERLSMIADSIPDSQPQEWAVQVQDLAYDIQDFVDIYSWLHIRSPRHALAHVSNIVQLKHSIRTLREWQHRAMSSHGVSGNGAASSGPPTFSSPHTPEDRLVGIEDPMSELLELVLLLGEFEKATEQLRMSSVDIKKLILMQLLPSPTPTEVKKPGQRRLRFVEGDVVEDVLPSPEPAEKKRLRVVSIVGYRGIGKTALARAVYDVANTVHSSHCRGFELVAWVVASQCSHGRELLNNICQQVREQANDTVPNFYMFKEILRSKRFLIVIDDLQEAGLWHDIQSAFPEAHNGSRVIVTTSVGSVAGACSPERYIYRMRCLGHSDSEKLFWTRVDSRTNRTPSLEHALEDTLRKSGGLPLALISVANNLCRKGQSLPPGAPGAFEEMNRVLSQSYDSLPDNGHRACFLSLSTFPQGHLIKRKKLIRRWIAEGLVVGDGVLSAEQVANNRFDELIDRNMIEPVLTGYNSKVKGFLVLGVIQDFIVNKSISKEFITLIHNDELLYPNKRVAHPVRRLSVHGGTQHSERVSKGIGLARVRSLTICNTVPFDFKDCWLLRVLDLEVCQGVDKKVLNNICKLVFLKYLSLRGSDVYKISKKIKKLECLETLDIRETRVETLPIEVFMLPRLSHLFGQFELPRQLKDPATKCKLQAFFCEKSRLQTLSGFVMAENNDFEHIVLDMRLLKKITIWCKHSTTSSSYQHLLTSSLEKRLAGRNALDSISINFGNESINFLNNIGAPFALIGSMKLWGSLKSLPSFITSHDTTLSELQLFSTGLTIEALSLLQNLRRLLYLKLVEDGDGFCGDCFVVQRGGFPSLLRLCFEAPKLPQIHIHERGMSSLTSLHLLCPELATCNNTVLEESYTETYSDKSIRAVHPGRDVEEGDPKISFQKTDSGISSSDEIQEVEETNPEGSSKEIKRTDLETSFNEIDLGTTDLEKIKNKINLKKFFKGFEHLDRLNELVLHPSVSREILVAWKEEARSHINTPKVTRQSTSMLTLNKGSSGTTKKKVGFGVQTSDHHVLVEVSDEEQTQSDITGEQSEGIMGRNVPTMPTSVHLMLQLRKYILLLASAMVTVTYTAGFNPPGGVWKDTVAGHLAGDPIIRETHYNRYLVFFYFNATAFAASLLLSIVCTLIDKYSNSKIIRPLQAVMVVDLLCLMGAYVAGTGRDMFTTIYSVVVASVFVFLVANRAVVSWFNETSGVVEAQEDELLKENQRFRKVLMVLMTFAVSLTYTVGLSTPGGIWDTTETGHRPGDAILKDRHNTRLKVLSGFNTAAFGASLVLIAVLLDSKIRKKNAYMVVVLTLVSLIGAYVAGSYRQTGTAFYMVSLVASVPVWIGFILLLAIRKENSEAQHDQECIWLQNLVARVTDAIQREIRDDEQPNQAAATDQPTEKEYAAAKARSLVVLLGILAAATTYLAGLHPPGGVWKDNGDGHKAGDPILLTTNAWRYKAFIYCNSVTFMASLVAIVFVQKKPLLGHHILKPVMILDLFGLIGAYVAGSSRDVWTSVVTLSMAAIILVQVVFHVVIAIFITKRLRTQDHTDNGNKDDELVHKMRKRFLLFTIFMSTITYRAGLNPPGGFLLQDQQSGHRAGDPVLSYNFPHRYKAFVTCNSVSFMLSTYILLRCLTLYRPATRGMLSACKAAVLYGLIGAYAAGSSQHLKTSIYIFVLAPVVLFLVVPLFRLYLVIISCTRIPVTTIGHSSTTTSTTEGAEVEGITEAQQATKRKKMIHAELKYRVLLGIIVASVTYMSSLEPPGGAWQSSSGGYEAGNPVMYDNRRTRYLGFFYANSTSFVASMVALLLLVPIKLLRLRWRREFLDITTVVELLGLLGAYAAGSTRDISTSIYVFALLVAVLAYFGFHLVLLSISKRSQRTQDNDHQERRGSQV